VAAPVPDGYESVKHNAHATRINYFQKCWDLGYHNLLPVVPPDGGISNAGKRPGILLPDGKWIGKASKTFEATPQAIEAWHEMGASVGLSCNGTGFTGIDVDTLTPRWADHISGLAHDMLGPAPRRIGRAPKVLLPYNCPPDMRYSQVRFRDDESRPVAVGDRKLAPGLVEVLAGETKWFVGWGIHPQTRQPYSWPDGMPPRAELTLITLAQRDAFMEQLRAELPDARRQLTSDSKPIAAEKLMGDPRLVMEAMRVIPNDPAVVDYHAWIRMAAALRGAVGYADGLELFEEWSDKAGFTGEESSYTDPPKAFASLDAERLRLGANYIYDEAAKTGWTGWAAPLIDRWFVEHPEVEEQPYESIFGGVEEEAVRISASAWEYVDPAAIPARDFLYGFHIVRRFASMTVAPSKVGKSTLATVDVLAMVTGRQLLPHMKPKGALRVWYINGEDPLEELQRRIAATMIRYAIPPADVGDRLFLDSGRSLRLVIAAEDKSGVKLLHPVISALVAELKARRIDVLVVDPFVSSHRVSENDNSGIDAVMSEWIMVADAANCGIEFVHHARKASAGADPDGSVDAARGASALVAKMRSVRALAKMTKAQGKQFGLTTTYRSMFRVTDAASNLAPWVDDETEWLRLENVDLGNGPVVAADAAARWSEGDHVAVVVAWALSGRDAGVADSQAVLQAIGSDAWREDAQARDDWVGNVVAMALNLDLTEPDDKATVKRLVAGWIKGGILERFQGEDKKRNKRWYVRAKSVFD
jgi:hypothetical protein